LKEQLQAIYTTDDLDVSRIRADIKNRKLLSPLVVILNKFHKNLPDTLLPRSAFGDIERVPADAALRFAAIAKFHFDAAGSWQAPARAPERKEEKTSESTDRTADFADDISFMHHMLKYLRACNKVTVVLTDEHRHTIIDFLLNTVFKHKERIIWVSPFFLKAPGG